MFLMDGGHAAAHWDERVAEIKAILDRHACQVIRMVKWDDRRLAYAVSHSKRGAYVLVFYEAPKEANRLIERDVQLSDNLLRLLIVRREKMAVEDMMRYRVPSREKNIIGEDIELPPEEPRPEPVAAAAPRSRRRNDDDGDSDSDSDR
jgi:ribosomal protein S6